jgi:hypothetical protein
MGLRARERGSLPTPEGRALVLGNPPRERRMAFQAGIAEH